MYLSSNILCYCTGKQLLNNLSGAGTKSSTFNKIWSRWLTQNSTRWSNMRSPGEFLSREFLKVKYNRQLSTEYPPELRRVWGPIESTEYT